MVQYFTNHCLFKKMSTVLSTTAVKVPCATNALEVFAKDKKQEIWRKMVEKQGEGTVTNDNIALYKEVRDKMWGGLGSTSKEQFEKEAMPHNNTISQGPTDKDLEQ